MTSVHSGVAHQPPGQGTIEYLPLEEVKVKAWVVDVSARIILSQTFYNSSERPTARAKYVFPLPANAAACAFELELEGGSIIVGEVKEKEEAELSFARAAAAGRTAGLIERITDDIFTISIGSIPARTKVTAHLTFVMDLLDEAVSDHVRLQLPMSIAERYGTPSRDLRDASAASSRTRVQITVDIQMSDVIHDIRSPTHPISLRRYKSSSGRKSQRRKSAVWNSNEFLTSDFVVTIHAEGLDRPRCFAEVLGRRDAVGGQGCTVAMQLTLVPKFLTPKIPSQEFIFVIDRSGSMNGLPIETAKRTLAMLLRLLPTTQTIFNIFSFGSQVTALWSHGIDFSQTTLAEATLHVGSMKADYHGTEIPKALQSAFKSRRLDRPTAVFLLTDGNIQRDDSLNPSTVIRTAIQNSPSQAPLRLFVLGIGAGVSSDICSSLAREGNGEYLFALSTEEILGKCARLLNAGRSKNIERIDVDWTYGASNASIPQVEFSLPAPTLPSDVAVLEPPPALQQTPHSLTKIFSGIRFTVFAVVAVRTVPTSVELSTKLQGVSEPLELIVDVIPVKPFRGAYEDSMVPMVHTLAVRKLIMELDDKVGPLPTAVSGDALLISEDELRRAGIVRLGLTYQLVSKHTSFVAIQQGSERSRTSDYGRTDPAWAGSRLLRTRRSKQKVSEAESTFLGNLVDGFASIFTSVFDFLGGSSPLTTVTASPQPRGQPTLPGAFASFDSGASDNSRGWGRDDPGLRGRQSPASHYSTGTFSTLSSLEGSSRTGSSVWSTSRSPSPQPRVQDPLERAPSPEFIVDQNSRGGGNPTRSTKPVQISQDIYDLFMQMDVDGSFASSPLLIRLVGDAVLDKGDELGIDKRAWATAVVAAYLKRHTGDESDLVELLLEKAREFVEAFGGGHARRFDDMVRRASAALSI